MMQLVRAPEFAESEQFEHSEKRYGVVLSAQIVSDWLPSPVAVRICNISEGGLMAVVPPHIALGGSITVIIRHFGKLFGRIVWTQKDKVGIKFDELIDPVALLADRAERALAPSRMANKFVELTRRTIAVSAAEHPEEGPIGPLCAV